MPKTSHFVQIFGKRGRRLISGHPEECKTSDQAFDRALRALDRAAGVVVFSVTGEPEFGEVEPPVVLARYGEVSGDFL